MVARDALASGDYEKMGGDPDLYKYFCQRYRALVRETGFVGVVLPRTVFNTKGSEGFREWLYVGSATHRIDFLLNRGRWIFDSEPRYSIALVVAERSSPTAAHRIEVAGTATTPSKWTRQARSGGVSLARRVFGPRWETPLLRSQQEADVLVKMRVGNRFPLGAGTTKHQFTPPPNIHRSTRAGAASPSPSSTRLPTRSSGAFPVRELDETNDKRFWQGGRSGGGAEARTASLWKGESFDQYNPSGVGERTCRVTPELLRKARKPRPGSGSLIANSISVRVRRQAVIAELDRAQVAFRDVARSTDSRTIRACLVPPGVFLTNTAPYLAFVDGDPVDQAVCLGIMNSLAFDWQARRFIEIHANFFLLEGLYLPDLADDDFGAIAQAAARLSAVDDRFADFAAATGVDHGPLDRVARTELRVDIDARVARAWNLTAADLDVIFRDFTEDAVTPAYRAALVERLETLA